MRSAAAGDAPSGLREIRLELVEASRYQPRSQFDESSLAELAQSMRAGGVVQPIVVRPMGSGYELIAGERRLRAARVAGLSHIPAIVRVLSDEQAVQISLVENLQREDLNPLEQARAFERLASEFGQTQEEIAAHTGKDRATVANTMRLLRLPVEIQALLEGGRLSAGHARALLKLEENPALLRVLAKRMAARRVSVRQAEEMVERKLGGYRRRRLAPRPLEANLKAAQETMERALGTSVRIVESRGGQGRIEIDYYNINDLNRIYYILVNKQAPGRTPTT
jgi:ParB family chromosome partitioning protein